MNASTWRRLGGALLICLGLTNAAAALTPLSDELLAPSVPRPAPRARPEIEPQPALFTSRPTLYAARSGGGTLVTVEAGEGGDELWLYPAAQPAAEPRLLLRGPARLSAPALSRDGRSLAWIDSRDDVKGDLWVLDLTRAGEKPRRLSDARSEEHAPVFTPDGRAIVVHQLLPGSELRRLVRFDLTGKPPDPLAIAIDAAFAAPAPDGRSWVFVSRQSDPGGDLWLLDASGALQQLTSGPERELYPAWESVTTLLFSRLPPAAASAGEGAARAELCRLDLARRDSEGRPRVFPLTVPALSALAPLPAGERFYFVAAQPGGGQCLFLPAGGEIPVLGSLAEQWELAQRLLERRPFDAAHARLACAQVLAQEHEPSREGAQASLALIELLEGEGRLTEGLALANEAARRYAAIPEASTRATLAALRLDAQLRCSAAAGSEARKAIALRAAAALEDRAVLGSDDLAGRALIDGGRVLEGCGGVAVDRLAALAHFERAALLPALSRPLRAEAAGRRALLLATMAEGEAGEGALLEVLRSFDDQERWAEAAVAALLDRRTPVGGELQEQTRQLAALAEANREALPRLAMGAWNRSGDLAYAAEEWSRARDAWRTVLDNFPPLTTPTAAARFALAELLFREERYAEATGLYETQMGEVPEDTPIYQLARAAYIRKRLASGESLFRLGEVAAARVAFLDLIRYEGRSLPAHRGYIKAVAAQGQAGELLLLYRKLLAEHPNDPVLLYGAGLCETYLPGKEHLLAAERSLLKAAERLPGSPYPPQTLGYVAEVKETVYGERGELERALALYRRAALLNRSDLDPDNGANLELNLGNVAFLLGRNATAHRHYARRLAAPVSFDHPETELLFYRRAGAVAFQVGATQEAIDRYATALQLVERRLDPARPLDAFGRLARRVNERLFGQKSKESPAQRAALAEQQAISAELDRLGATPPPAPPEPGWDAYAAALKVLLAREEALLAGAPAWSATAEQHGAELRSLRRRVAEELDAVPRLVETRAELHDRLGLATLEAGQFAAAQEHFNLAFDLNRRLGRTANLVLNRRSASLAAYRQAQAAAGAERLRLLEIARSGFGEVLLLIEKFPPQPKSDKGRGKGLISVDLAITLDAPGATAAAFGFTAEQERRLAETYLARIGAELGEPATALTGLRRQLARYPQEIDRVAPGDRFGLGLLSHRVAHLEYALGDEAAASDFRRALLANLSEGQTRGAMLNLVNWGRLLDPATPGAGDDFLRQEAEVAALAATNRATLPGWSEARFRLDGGSLLLRLAEAQIDPVARLALCYRALAAWDQALALTRTPRGEAEQERLALRGAALLNRGVVLRSLSLDAAADAAFAEGLTLAEKGQLPALAWRAESGLGRFDAALERLAALPPTAFDLQRGELFARFAPQLETLATEDAAAALALVERLSELERVQLLAPAFLALDDPGVGTLLRQAAPRLRERRTLQAKLDGAKPEERDYLRLRLGQEAALLSGILGAKQEQLPALYADSDRTLLDYLAAAASFSAAVDEAAAPDAPALRAQAAELDGLHAAFTRHCAANQGERSCALLLPQPVALADLDLTLEGRVVLRPVPLGTERWLLFTLDAEGAIRAEALSTATLHERIASAPGAILASEFPETFPQGALLTRSLSLAHLARSLAARQPFRRQVLDPSGWWPAAAPFVRLPGDDAVAQLPFAHTLVLPGQAGLLAEPPAGDAASGTLRLAYADAAGRRRPLDLTPALGLALVVAPQAGVDQAYALGQLLALEGVPSLLLAGRGVPAGPEFAAAYASESLSTAATRLPGGWLLLGDWGLDTPAAQRFARARFVELGKRGLAAQQQGEYSQALARFEDALAIAAEDPLLTAQLVPLRRAARESAYSAGRLDRALVHAAALVDELARREPYSAAHADALLRYGLLCGLAERFGEAEAALKESVATFADLGLVKEQAAALGGFGQVMENALDYGSAGALFGEAAALRQQLGDELSLADQYRNLGRLFDLRLSRYAEAERYYARAAELYGARGAPRLKAEALLERGRTRRLLGDFEAAEAFYQEALVGIASGELRTRARITLEKANNAWFQGRYQEAFEKRDEVERAALREGWSAEVVMAKNTGGLIWSTLGDQPRALVELRAALALAEEHANRQDEIATTLNNLGLVQRESGDVAGALVTLERALAIDRKLGSRWAMAYDLRNLGQCRLRLGQPERALADFTEAEVLAAAIGDQVSLAKILIARAEAELQLKKPTAARASFTRAQAIAERLVLPEVQWRALYGLARISEQAGEIDPAIAAYRQALTVIEELRAAIRLDQLKDGFLSDKGDVYSGLVGLLASLGRGDEAFDVAERSRARNLIDILGRQRLVLSGAGDQALYDRQNRLKEALREQERFVALATTDAERALYATASGRLRADYQDLLLEIERQRPELLSLVRVDPLSLAQLRELLEPGIVLLSYYQLADRLLCWRIDREGTTLFTLDVPAAELGALIGTYRRMLQNLEPLEKLSTGLHAQLLARPLAGVKEIRALGIIPHGSLHYLSFATLNDGRDFLVERAPLFYLPSASVLRYTLQRRPLEKNRRVLAIGNPDLGSPALDLPFAEREAAMLRWNYPEVTLLTRERATESWVREHINDFGIIHLASHGEFDPVNPLFSSLRLTRDAASDGRLEAEEIFGLDIQADLVVLSACQTGLGDLRKGDDVVGMNRAFLFAGTHALLSSLWRVSDVATAIEMKQFYRDYGRLNKADALRKAMLHVKGRYPHPGYWGAFVLTGDYM